MPQQQCTIREIFQIRPKTGVGNETEPVQVVVVTDPAARICHAITAPGRTLSTLNRISGPGGSRHERERRALPL